MKRHEDGTVCPGVPACDCQADDIMRMNHMDEEDAVLCISCLLSEGKIKFGAFKWCHACWLKDKEEAMLSNPHLKPEYPGPCNTCTYDHDCDKCPIPTHMDKEDSPDVCCPVCDGRLRSPESINCSCGWEKDMTVGQVLRLQGVPTDEEIEIAEENLERLNHPDRFDG